jgi:hypothetical protein
MACFANVCAALILMLQLAAAPAYVQKLHAIRSEMDATRAQVRARVSFAPLSRCARPHSGPSAGGVHEKARSGAKSRQAGLHAPLPVLDWR